MNPFKVQVRVYYEDVDIGGVVYYANYLRYFERARSEWLRSLGVNQERLAAVEGVGFVVVRASNTPPCDVPPKAMRSTHEALTALFAAAHLSKNT